MNTPAHEFPKPMWKKLPDGTVATRYANDQMDFTVHSQASARPSDLMVAVDGYGWSPNYIKQEFPSVVHGPNGQTLSVKNADEKARALANGWSLRPVGTEVDPRVGPITSPDQPPHGMESAEVEEEETAEPPKRGRGRPRREEVEEMAVTN